MVRYKLIEHERTEDAPFIGALISSVDCNYKCEGCFNQHLKELPEKCKHHKEVIEEIKSNPFNEGIILAGLEWSNQIDEAIKLSKEAREQGLQSILYTGNDELNKDHFVYFDYVKQGKYDKRFEESSKQYNILLSTSNQRVYKKGVDY